MPANQDFLLKMRNFIFGAEDSLVSTVGLLSGITSAGADKRSIVITGIVLIIVEAFSMAVGSYLSEQETEESEGGIKRSGAASIAGGGIMLLSYIIAGLAPLLPYVLLNPIQALPYSITASLISLMALGLISAKVLKIKILHSTIRMLIMGGMAIALGVFVGSRFK